MSAVVLFVAVWGGVGQDDNIAARQLTFLKTELSETRLQLQEARKERKEMLRGQPSVARGEVLQKGAEGGRHERARDRCRGGLQRSRQRQRG